MARLSALLPIALTLVAGAARADFRGVDQKILEYNAGQARAELAKAGGSEAERLAAEGRILAIEKKFSEAEGKLKRATELRGDDAATWNYLGELRERVANSAGAREAYQKASDLAKAKVGAGNASADAHYQLGRALAGLRSFDGAVEHLRHAQQGGAPLATYQLGVTRATQENWKEAFDLLSQAIGANNGIAYAYYYRGMAASQVGRKDVLLDDFDRFLKLAPTAPEAARVKRLLASAKR